jgi:hypothetical protein
MNVSAAASRMQAPQAAQVKPPTRNDHDGDDRSSSSVAAAAAPKVSPQSLSAGKGIDTYA